MLGLALAAVVIVSIVAVGCAALSAPRRAAALYGIVLDDRRTLAFIRAMGARDLVIGGLTVVPERPGDDVIDNDLILVWGEQRRIITGSDLLGRLLRGIVTTQKQPAAPAVATLTGAE